MKKIKLLNTTLLLIFITLLSLQCSESNPSVKQDPTGVNAPLSKKMTFFNGGLKAGITVEIDTSGDKISGTLTKETDYEKQEIFPFTSNQSFQEGIKICMTFKDQETGYPLPMSQEADASCWRFEKNEKSEFGLYIPTHGKNYDTGAYMDYVMFLELVKE